MEEKEIRKLYGKYGITARKHGGDDRYSWAVFVKGRLAYSGMEYREIGFYKREVLISILKGVSMGSVKNKIRVPLRAGEGGR